VRGNGDSRAARHLGRLGWLLLLVVALTLCLVLVPLLPQLPLERIEDGLATARSYAAAVRWIFILLLVWRWPAVANVLGRWRCLPTPQVQALQSRRWQLLALLAAVEILVAEQGLRRLLEVLA
jgi:hypothetical protein